MNALDYISKKYQIVLGEAKHAADMQWDCTSADTIGFAEFHGTTDGTNPIDIISGIASVPNPPSSVKGVRQMAVFSCYNADDITHTVTIQLVDSATSTTTPKFTVNMAQGYSLHYENGKGWYMLDKNLSLVTTVVSDSTLTIGETVSGGTHGSLLYTDYSGNLANSILNEDSGGNYIFPTNGKFISSADGNIQQDFGSGSYYRLTTDAGVAATSYFEIYPTSVTLFANGIINLSGTDGAFQTALAVTPGSNQITQTSALGYWEHSTKIELNAPIYKFTQLTASTVPYLDASKNLVSSSVTPTELGYVSGVTSSIQTQINNINAGLSWKLAVLCATTTNITLSGEQTIDGVTTSSSRVLVKNQSTASQNGIYISSSGSWTRATDCSTGGSTGGATSIIGATVVIEEGSTLADQIWTCSTDPPITIGSTSITFVKTSATTYTADGSSLTLTGNQFSINTSWIGQTAITTLGTITTGTWNATKITDTYLNSSYIYADGSRSLSADWDAGAHVISAQAEKITGTGGNGFISILTQSSQPANPASGGVIYFNASSHFAIRKQSDTYERAFSFGTLAADAVYTFPNATATMLYSGGALGTPSSGTLSNCTTATQAANTNNGTLASTAYVDATQNNSTYRTVVTGTVTQVAGNTAGTYIATGGGIASGTTTATALNCFYLTTSDFPSVNGITAKLRIRFNINVNHTAPTGNWYAALFPITSPASSGGAGVRSYTIGTEVVGSKTTTQNTPSADTQYNLVGSDFDVPADGLYAVCIVITGTVATNSFVSMQWTLQMRNA